MKQLLDKNNLPIGPDHPIQLHTPERETRELDAPWNCLLLQLHVEQHNEHLTQAPLVMIYATSRNKSE